MEILKLISSPISTFLAGIVFASIFFLLKRNNEQIDKRQKAATKFLAKINACLIDAKLKNNQGNECICEESYAEFRLTVSGKKATELETCWHEYIVQKVTSGTRCVECVECLHTIVHEVTKSKSSTMVPECVTCSSSKIIRTIK